MDLIKKKIEERVRLHEQNRTLVGEGEKNADQKMTTEQVKTWNERNDDIDALRAEIDVLERQDKLDAEMASNVKTEVETREFKDMSKDEIRDNSNSAWRSFILGGGDIERITKDELRFLNPGLSEKQRIIEQRTNAQSTTDAKGGFTIPEGFSNELEIAQLAFGNMPGVARIFPTAEGNDIPWPSTNDTGTVAYQIGEAVDNETSATDVPFLQAFTLKAYKWTSGMVRVSSEIIQDSAFNMVQLLKDLFAIRMGRGLNAAYTTGDGSSKIEGFITGSTDSNVSAAVDGISRDNLIDLEHSVDPAYRINGRFMFNDSTLAILKKLDIGSSDGRPLWQAGMAVGAPDTIDGFPYSINQQMADVAANAKSVAFGDFSKYIIRKVAGDRIVVTTERYVETDQIGIMILQRRDGHVLDAGTNPIKYLTNAAT